MRQFLVYFPSCFSAGQAGIVRFLREKYEITHNSYFILIEVFLSRASLHA
jgi:hypothetical protein